MRADAPVAQRIEHLPSKQMVVGSNPARGAKLKIIYWFGKGVNLWLLNDLVYIKLAARM
jgi:hypothetical protein